MFQCNSLGVELWSLATLLMSIGQVERSRQTNQLAGIFKLTGRNKHIYSYPRYCSKYNASLDVTQVRQYYIMLSFLLSPFYVQMYRLRVARLFYPAVKVI